MATVSSIKVWSNGETLTSTDLNTNFATIRDALVARGLFTDEARTVSAVLTFSAAPVFTNAQTFAAGVTVTTGGLTVTAGASTFGADVGVTGTVTATTFSGSGSGLTGLPAAELTGTLPAISGANLTNLTATNLSGTVPAGNLPTTYTSALTVDPGVNQLALTIARGCNITFTTNSGAAGSRPAFDFAADYYVTGANTPPSLGTAPIAGSSWRWLRVQGVFGTGYVPVLS